MSSEIDDELSDDEQYVSLDIETVKNNIPTFSSHKLCEMIVCDRYFGCYKDIAIMCMKELSNRRSNGDMFDFETYIENSYKELPALNFNPPDLREALLQAVVKK